MFRAFQAPLIACAAAVLLAPAAQAACYTVYAGNGQVVYRSQQSPVDLSLPFGDTVPQRFGPGTSMIATADTVCGDEIGTRTGNVAKPVGSGLQAVGPALGKSTGLPASLEALAEKSTLERASSTYERQQPYSYEGGAGYPDSGSSASPSGRRYGRRR